MSASELVQVWVTGTVLFATLAGIGVLVTHSDVRRLSPPHPEDIAERRFAARIALASPIWPVLILAAVGYVLLILVRWAR